MRQSFTTIPAGSGKILRIKLNAKSKGKYNNQILLKLREPDTAIVIALVAKVNGLNTRGLQDCPTFGDIPSGRKLRKASRNRRQNIRLESVDLGMCIAEPTEEKRFEGELTSLSRDRYKANSLVFLIDVSSSMKRDDKFDLLKTSMKTLLEPLREIDQMSLITYADQADILLPPTASSQKDSIEKVIEALTTKGSTNAIGGIDLALQTGINSFLTDGNNQVFIVTDGAFRFGKQSDKVYSQLKDAAIKGVKTSVLAIKSERWAYSSLKEIVENGDGNLIKIKKWRHRKRILKKVKNNSKY